MKADWTKRDKVPVVMVRLEPMEECPTVYTGYGAQLDGGCLIIFEMTPGFDAASEPIRKPFGHTIVLANGMWATCEMEWQDRT
jgi:hypothetical protein